MRHVRGLTMAVGCPKSGTRLKIWRTMSMKMGIRRLPVRPPVLAPNTSSHKRTDDVVGMEDCKQALKTLLQQAGFEPLATESEPDYRATA